MAKIVICGDAVVITSAIKLEDIEFLQKYRKDALTLLDDDYEPIFKIGVADCGCGCIGTYGAEFSPATRDDQGLAVITIICIAEGDDIKEQVADMIGSGLVKLNKLEAKLPEIISNVKAERQAIIDSITIAQ